MNNRYAFAPDESALGETEKFYTDMAAKGWKLVNRGVFIDHFIKAEPEQMKYRVEVASPRAFEDAKLPEEQIAVYEDCGWEYVGGSGYLHVFRAPADSDTEEFYLDPAQQAKTLKGLRGKCIGSFLYVPIYTLFLLGLGVLVGGTEFGAQFWRGMIEETALICGASLLLVQALSAFGYRLWSISRLYHRMKSGVPLDHAPSGKHWLKKIVSRCFAALMAAAAVLILVQWADKATYEMPPVSDAPYVGLADFGVTGERTKGINGDVSTVKYNRSLLCEYWDTAEYIQNEKGNLVWLYQDTYRIPNAYAREKLIAAWKTGAIFARSPEDFQRVEIAGLDEVWVSRMECIAVKGNLVCHFTYVFGENEDITEELAGLAAHWSAAEPAAASRG